MAKEPHLDGLENLQPIQRRHPKNGQGQPGSSQLSQQKSGREMQVPRKDLWRNFLSDDLDPVNYKRHAVF